MQSSLIQKFAFIKKQIRPRFYDFLFNFKSHVNTNTGINTPTRNPPLIVSLTSIPSRIHKLHICVETLLNQLLRPDSILLWLDDLTIKNGIPPILQRQQSRGLTIRQCDDIGPYKKIIYTLKENTDAIVVTADDDMFYPNDWLLKLYQAYKREPQYIHCYRASLMAKESSRQMKKYLNWTGGGGSLQGPSLWLYPTNGAGSIFPPESLHSEVFNKNVFMDIAPTADDAWLKAMSLLNRVECKKIFLESKIWHYIPETQKQILYLKNYAGLLDRSIKDIFDKYNIYDILQ